MSLSRTNFILSNVNALLGSTATALEAKNKGANPSDIAVDFGLNVMNGAVRNEIAYDMRKTTGSNLGFLINNMAGYGNEAANSKGMMGLMGAFNNDCYDEALGWFWRLLLYRRFHERRFYGRFDIWAGALALRGFLREDFTGI